MLYGSNTSASLFGMLIVSVALVQHCVGLSLSRSDGLLLCVSDFFAVLLSTLTLLVASDYKSVVLAP